MICTQVAMGRQKEIDTVDPDRKSTGFNSFWAMGRKRPDPEFDVVLPSGKWTKL